MNPLVSVVIPIYNSEKFIKECVDSVLSQTYKNIEIVLINDGSKDNSLQICTELTKSNKNIVLFNQENKGVSAARNNGIKNSKGDFLFFLDSDDLLPPSAIQILVQTAITADYDMTIGKLSDNDQFLSGELTNDEFLIKVLEDNPIAYSSCGILYKHSLINDVLFPEGFISGEDSYFIFECALKKPKVAIIDTQVYIYRENPTSVTRFSFTSKHYNDIRTLLLKKEDIIKTRYADYLPIFYHLKTKVCMMVLNNLAKQKGRTLKRETKQIFADFNSSKQYFRADLPYSNYSFYKILSKKLFIPYKFYRKLILFIKKFI